jgi:hypothetical protein
MFQITSENLAAIISKIMLLRIELESELEVLGNHFPKLLQLRYTSKIEKLRELENLLNSLV